MLSQEPKALSAVRRLRSTNWWSAAAHAPRQPLVTDSTCCLSPGQGDTLHPREGGKGHLTMWEAASYCAELGKKKQPTNPNSITSGPVFRLSHAPPGQTGADVHNTAGNVRRTRLKHLLCLPTLKERHFWSLFLLL